MRSMKLERKAEVGYDWGAMGATSQQQAGKNNERKQQESRPRTAPGPAVHVEIPRSCQVPVQVAKFAAGDDAWAGSCGSFPDALDGAPCA